METILLLFILETFQPAVTASPELPMPPREEITVVEFDKLTITQ